MDDVSWCCMVCGMRGDHPDIGLRCSPVEAPCDTERAEAGPDYAAITRSLSS